MEEKLSIYLNSLLQRKDDWVYEIEKQALEEKVPIMDSLGIHFFMQLIRLSKPRKLLEIGTGIGYSALRMLEANEETEIVTIERDRHRYDLALENINKYHAQHKIKLLYGDALEIMAQLQKEDTYFDCVFIDAAKGQYKRFFNLAQPLLSAQGFIVSDNVLFRGYVVDIERAETRFKKMVEKLKAYNQWISNHPDFITTIVPIGDGVAVSQKLK